MGQREVHTDSPLGVEALKSVWSSYQFPGTQDSNLCLNPGFTTDCVTLSELLSSFWVLNVHLVPGTLCLLFHLILTVTLRRRSVPAPQQT